jgi:hypothetical protein
LPSRDNYIRQCKTLVRDGTDQCRVALKRYGSKTQFRLHRIDGSLTKKDWKKSIENLDLQFDLLDKDVESIVRDARKLCEDIVNLDVGVCTAEGGDDDSETFSFDREESDEESSNWSNDPSPKLIQLHPHARVVPQTKKYGEHSRKKSNNVRKHRISGKPNEVKKKRKKTNSQTKGDKHAFGTQTKIRSRSYSNRGTENRKETRQVKASGDLSQKRAPKRKGDKQFKIIKGSKYLHRNGVKKYHRAKASRTPRSKDPKWKEQQASNSIEHERPRALPTEGENCEHYAEDEDFDVTNLSSLSLTEEIIFNDLKEKEVYKCQLRNEIDEPITNLDDLSINDICDKLSVNYPTNEQMSRTLLYRLPLLFDNPHVLDGNAHYVSISVFETILKIFKTHGSETLQEMIQFRSKSLFLHVKLLICTIQILKRKLHSHLNKKDGVIYHIFSVSGEASIVEFTILQLIDVLYSQLLPVAWGKPLLISPNVYEALQALRDELGSVVHLTEIVSKLLYTRFEFQRWQRSNDASKKKWFVSSMDCKYASKYWNEYVHRAQG